MSTAQQGAYQTAQSAGRTRI